ncbi:FAD binding domain-containing protein [Phreatobacter sp.]|uniref:FAD binding domain-containing protein n=1 Tax=Phreatobacter sp. TaxID=1966341 RepID=UPI003F70DD3E
MKWPAFDYVRVTALDDLWPAWQAAGPEARVLAGGQSLLATLAFRLSDPPALLDIRAIAALKGIVDLGDRLRIGALTTHAELGRNALVAAHAPMLHQAVPLIAHAAIRNRGTIGGSLALADPAAELPACAVALDATLVLVSAAGERRIAAADFFRDLFETALEPFEILAAIEIGKASPGSLQAIVETVRRSGDYAIAGVAVALALNAGTIADPRIVCFGVGSHPVAAAGAMAALDGRPLGPEAIHAAREALRGELDPSADLHGPAALKRHLAGVLLSRALASFMPAEEEAA